MIPEQAIVTDYGHNEIGLDANRLRGAVLHIRLYGEIDGVFPGEHRASQIGYSVAVYEVRAIAHENRIVHRRGHDCVRLL